MTIAELLDKKKDKVQAANEIRDRVYKDQNGEWRGDDEAKFDALMADSEKITREIERSAKLEAAQKSLEEGQPAERRTAPTNPSRQHASHHALSLGGADKQTRLDHESALRAWFLAGSNRTDERATQAADRIGLNPASTNVFLALATRAPRASYGRDGRVIITREDWQEWEERYLGVAVVSPDDGGHNLVPNEMMRAMEEALLSFGGMRSVATTIRTDSGADLPFPVSNDTSNKGSIISEGTEETTETLPTLTQMVLNSFTYTSNLLPVSYEFMQDNAVNFQGRVGSMLGERIARATNEHFTVGTGSGQPRGIVAAATSSGVTTASATAISYDELVDLVHSVDPDYRKQNARFMFHDNTLKALKKIKVPQFSGDTAGYPLWKAGMAVGDPDTIDGYPYTVNQDMPTPASNNKAIVFGALWKYQIRDVRVVEVQRLNEIRAAKRQVVWLAWSRHDGDLLDAGTHPVKYLTMHS